MFVQEIVTCANRTLYGDIGQVVFGGLVGKAYALSLMVGHFGKSTFGVIA